MELMSTLKPRSTITCSSFHQHPAQPSLFPFTTITFSPPCPPNSPSPALHATTQSPLITSLHSKTQYHPSSLPSPPIQRSTLQPPNPMSQYQGTKTKWLACAVTQEVFFVVARYSSVGCLPFEWSRSGFCFWCLTDVVSFCAHIVLASRSCYAYLASCDLLFSAVVTTFC